jgi:hypothetical protein
MMVSFNRKQFNFIKTMQETEKKTSIPKEFKCGKLKFRGHMGDEKAGFAQPSGGEYG